MVLNDFSLLEIFWQCLKTFMNFTNWGMLLESSGQRPRMLLNILKYAEQPTTTKNYPAPNVTVERLGNFGIDLYLRCNSRSFLCTDLDIFHSACLGKGTWTIMPHVPPGNTLGKLPFVASVLTDKQHLQKTPQFPHFELLDRWTWRPDGAHRPDTKKCR